MKRRTFLKGVGIGAAGFGAGYLTRDHVDLGRLPYKASGFILEEMDKHVGPGESPPPGTEEFMAMPEDYQDYIDPSLDADLEDIAEVEFEWDSRDWKRPREYLDEGGDCEDHATAVASVLEGDGEYARVVIGSYRDTAHVVAEDSEGGTYAVGFGPEPVELDDWQPVLMFSKDEELQGYRPPE